MFGAAIAHKLLATNSMYQKQRCSVYQQHVHEQTTLIATTSCISSNSVSNSSTLIATASCIRIVELLVIARRDDLERY